jgi:hypothetical protein
MSVTVTVRNKDKLARKLHALAPEALKDLTEANIKTGEEMVAKAQGFVKTGTLRSTIRSEFVGGDTGAVRVLAGGAATTVKGYDYALAVEFGTVDTPRQPYFFPSFRLGKKTHRGRATRALNKSAKRVAGK